MTLQLAAPTRRRFTVDEYHQMAKVGILGEDERVELIDGEIVVMSPIGRKHANRVRRIIRLFSDLTGQAAILDVQNPVELGEHSEPQPDVVLLRPRPDFYETPPTAADILLLVEVSDTTAQYDRSEKVPLYARSGVPEVWLADLPQDVLLVYRDPTPDGYRTIRVAQRGEQIAALAFPDRPIAVADILG
jgi:Uma2 family endonuclease